MSYMLLTEEKRCDLEKLRLKAFPRLVTGIRNAEIAREFGVSRMTVGRWRKLVKAGGRAALLRGRTGGRPPRIRDRQALAELIRGNPLPGKELANLIEKTFGVRHHRDYIYHLAKRYRQAPNQRTAGLTSGAAQTPSLSPDKSGRQKVSGQAAANPKHLGEEIHA